MGITVAKKDSKGQDAGTYNQSLQIVEIKGASFAGTFVTPGRREIAAATGTLQGDALTLYVQWKDKHKCSWIAAIDDQGVLTGQMQCAAREGGIDRQNPGGTGSVTF